MSRVRKNGPARGSAASSLDRRSLLSGAVAATSVLGLNDPAHAKRKSGRSEGGRERPIQAPPAGARFFTAEEFALVDELTDMIIPADSRSGGARAAGVAAYIDGWLAEHYDGAIRRSWREDIIALNEFSVAVHGRPVMRLTPVQRLALLERIAASEDNPKDDTTVFFIELKRMAALGYYTSKIGIHDDLEYLGNTSIAEYVGTDVSAKE